MPRFRKKPVVIEAIQWTGKNFAEVYSLALAGGRVVLGLDGHDVRITTPEGVMIASPGDWIIKGVAGELYPCKPKIFEQTYEEVEVDPTADTVPGVRR